VSFDPAPYRGGGRTRAFGLGLAAAGAALFVLSLLLEGGRAMAGWLTAFAALVSTVLGALVLLMIVHVMRATWPVALRRLVETEAALAPLCALLFVPLALGLRALYPWTHPSELLDAHQRALLAHKASYLNPSSFLLRAALYFLLWIWCALTLRRWSVRSDALAVGPAPEGAAGALEARMRGLSAAALPAIGLTLTFAAFDWLMSLTPLWWSTMYGFYFFAAGELAAVALLTLLAFALRNEAALGGVGRSHFYALGRLLLTFTIFWGYIAFFQFFLIWIADKPDEVTFYYPRMRTSWKWESVVLIFAHFALPFLVLLSYKLKQRRGALALVAGWLLVQHWIDLHWLIAPALWPRGFAVHLSDLAALALTVGLALAAGATLLRRAALAPVGDPRFPHALGYRSE
jgi:hypothetical protein